MKRNEILNNFVMAMYTRYINHGCLIRLESK